MFRQNDDISWRIRTCSGAATGSTVAVPRQRPRTSNRSEGTNTIDRFSPRQSLEDDRREIESADSERCLEPPRSLSNPPAYVASPYFVSSENFSRTMRRRESLLKRVLRLAAATDKSISTPPGASPPSNAGHCGKAAAHARQVSTIVMRRRRPISKITGISQGLLQGSAPRREPVCGSSHRSCRTRTYRMQRGWLV
ncbi:hypothetical protein ACVIYL_004656 [Bradyrhizobium sp. USDA 3315]